MRRATRAKPCLTGLHLSLRVTATAQPLGCQQLVMGAGGLRQITEGDFAMPWSCARVAGGAVAATIAMVVAGVPASAQPATPSPKEPGVGSSTVVACGVSYPARDFSGWHQFPANTVTLRSGPSNSCIQTGQGLHDQLAQYLCYTPGEGGTWTFLRNTSTGEQGWVRDDLLAGDGSQVPCEDNPPPAFVNPL